MKDKLSKTQLTVLKHYADPSIEINLYSNHYSNAQHALEYKGFIETYQHSAMVCGVINHNCWSHRLTDAGKKYLNS
jgi:hypothetical protein